MLYSVVFLIGIILGSFFNVCIYRIPRKISIVKPPSACTKCGTRLKAIDLLPVFSYIFLKGKCRYCNEKVSMRYLGIEMLTGIMYVCLFYRFGFTIDFLVAIFLMSILIIVFFIDQKHFIIPNALVLAALIGGVVVMVYNAFYPLQIYYKHNAWNPLMGMMVAVGFLGAVGLLGNFIYKTDEAMGMGDIKLFAAIGMFLGWQLTIVALFLSFLVGAAISVVLVVCKRKKRQDKIAFGTFIVVATFITIMFGQQFLSWYI